MMAERRLWLAMRCLWGKGALVMGLVAWLDSQLSMASCSYVYPSPAITGAFITSCMAAHSQLSVRTRQQISVHSHFKELC